MLSIDARAASAAPPASRGAVSITTRDAPTPASASTTRASLGGCAGVTTGGAPLRSRPHYGRRSLRVQVDHRSLSPGALMGRREGDGRVVFPLPPFCEISAIVRIMLCTLYQVRPSPCQPDRPADHSDSVRLSGFR